MKNKEIDSEIYKVNINNNVRDFISDHCYTFVCDCFHDKRVNPNNHNVVSNVIPHMLYLAIVASRE